jgi:hypothetical protein
MNKENGRLAQGAPGSGVFGGISDVLGATQIGDRIWHHLS